MKNKLHIIVAFTILSSISSFNVWAEPLTGPGSTLPENNTLEYDSTSLMGSLKIVYKEIKKESYGQVYAASVDVMLAAVAKSGVSINVNDTSVRNAFKRRLSGYLKKSVLSEDSLKGTFKKVGFNVVKGLIVNAMIKVASDVVYEQTGSLAAKEGLWLSLKMADSAISSGGNPAAAAVGQTLILAEVIAKDMEAADEALKARGDLKKTAAISDIYSLITDGAQKYSRGETDSGTDYLISTRKQIEELINSSSLDKNTKQELKNNYLVDTSSNSAFRIFKSTLENRETRRIQLLEERTGPEYEKFISYYYPQKDRNKYREEFDSYHNPVEKNKEKIATKNKERKEKLDEINKKAKTVIVLKKNKEINSEISRFKSERSSAKTKLDRLIGMGSGSNSSQSNTRELKMIRLSIILAGQRLEDGRWKSTRDIDKTLKKYLKKGAELYGMPFSKFFNLLKRDYSQYMSFIDDKISGVNNGSSGNNNQAEIERLKAEISRLDLLIGNYNSDLLASIKLLDDASETLYSAQKSLDDLIKDHSDILLDMNKLSNEFNDDVKFVASASAGTFVSNTSGETVFEVEEWYGQHSFAVQGQGVNFDHADTVPEGTVAIVSGKSVPMHLNLLRDYVQTGTDDHFGNYSYTAWGNWSAANFSSVHSAPVTHGHWVIGASNENEVPQQGSAIYNGELRGDMIDNNVMFIDSITGNITVNADFGSQQVSGSMAVTCVSSTCATAQFNNLSMDENRWNGSMDVDGGFGHIMGNFYGPKAAETGGMFLINKGSKAISGVFRAKQ